MLLLAVFQAISLLIMPRVAMYPNDIRIIVNIQRHPDNRQLTVEVSDKIGMVSRSDLDWPESSPPQYIRDLHRLPPGEYRVKATLLRTLNRTYIANDFFTILGGG